MGCCCASYNKVSDETKSLIAADQPITPQSFDTTQTYSMPTNDIDVNETDNTITKAKHTQSDDIHKETDHNEQTSEEQPFKLQINANDGHSLPILDETDNKETDIRIQIEQLPKFKQEQLWILDANREKESRASLKPNIKAYSYSKDIISHRRVTLTNSHNFLWFTLIMESSLKSAELESEISRTALDRVLNLTPVPFRDKIWEICNVEHDTFIVYEEFEEFVDALLIATGQYQIQNDENNIWELRNMSKVFKKIVSITDIFSDSNCVALNEKKSIGLSTKGATKVVMLLRNLNKENDIPANDIAIVFLTGFTKRAIRHSVKYCTRIYWKILTDVWWDEEDSDDMALPHDIEQYQKTKKHSRKKSNMSQDVKRHLSSTSIEELFGNDNNNLNL